MRRCSIGLTGILACWLVGCGVNAPPPTSVRFEKATAPAATSERPERVAYAMDGAKRESTARPTVAEAPASRTSPPRDDAWKANEAEVAGRFPESPAASAVPLTDPSVTRERTLEREEFNTQPQAGRLTAGSFDDNLRIEDYQQFLARMTVYTGNLEMPRLSVHSRLLIHVQDSLGRPVGNARVVVEPVNYQGTVNRQGIERMDAKPLAELLTGSDGRTTFLPGLDGDSGTGELLLTVSPADGTRSTTQVVRQSERTCVVTLTGTQSRLPSRLDLALVVDTTGSMGDELNYLKAEFKYIVETVRRLFPQVDPRFALIVYRDQGDEYVTRTFDFTSSLPEFHDRISQQRAAGGGDYPEAMQVALEQGRQLSWRSQDTARVMFLVGDAPPHDQDAGRALEAVRGLRRQGVRIFPIAASGTEEKAEYILRAASFLTMGEYLFLTDHSGVGNPHARPHVPVYQVEPLNQLMIRMIASELAARRFAPKQVLAIEGEQAASQQVSHQQSSSQQTVNYEFQYAAAPQFRFVPPWNYLSWRWIVLALAVVSMCVVDAISRRKSA